MELGGLGDVGEFGRSCQMNMIKIYLCDGFKELIEIF